MKRLIVFVFVFSSLFWLSSCSSTKVSKSQKNRTVSVSKTGPKTGSKTEKDVLKRYSKELNVPVAKLQTPKLYEFIDQWIGVPYLYGGTSKKGVDCSGFVGIVYKNLTDRSLPRSTGDLYKVMKTTDKLQEGDLVFFNYKGKNSHVGIYLHNGKFIHASTTLGVTISDLNSDHYKKTFSCGGPLKIGRLNNLSK